MYIIFFILFITITCVVVNINRKEQNKTEEKEDRMCRNAVV